MTECLEIACGIAVVTILLYYYLLATNDFWKVRGVVGPKPIPVFGNIKDVLFGKRTLIQYLEKFYNQYKHQGMFGIFIMREPFLVLTDPELIKNILIKDFSNFTDKGIIIVENADPLSPHLFNLEPKRWRPMRARLTPIFTSGKLKDMFRMISECSENLVKLVEKVAETGEPVQVYELATRFTIDVIGTCAFGIDIKTLAEDNCEFLRLCKTIFEPTSTGMAKFRLQHYFPSAYKLLAVFLQQKEITSFFVNITADTMKHRRENKIYRNDFINTLLELQDHPEKLGDLQLTDKLTTAQAFIFFAAGFETTSTTISNALYELALNQEIQSKLREEIKETYLISDGNMDYATIKTMQFLDAVFRETLRKYPPLPYLRRKSENSYTFEGTKVTIPKKQNIVIPVYAIQHDPSIYPNPDVFDPDRFGDGRGATRHPMHFLPFGDGPRNCIGARFAVHQTKIGLIKIIRDYKIDVCEKTPISYVPHPQAFIVTPREPIYLRISKCE